MTATLSQFTAALAAMLLCAVCQGASVTQEQVAASAAARYAARLAASPLDRDPRLDTRVRAIAAVLIGQARRDYPFSAGWAWEVHTTDDPDQNADSMAGGKLLVGSAYIARLGLNDAELAMLLAHEIAHALLLHHLKEYQAALQLEPAWAARPFSALEDAVDNDRALMARLAELNYAQEREADREGMLLAWRAGWPAAALAGYFRKMQRASDRPGRSRPDYPSPSQRWRAAQALSAGLQKNHVQPDD